MLKKTIPFTKTGCQHRNKAEVASKQDGIAATWWIKVPII